MAGSCRRYERHNARRRIFCELWPQVNQTRSLNQWTWLSHLQLSHSLALTNAVTGIWGLWGHPSRMYEVSPWALSQTLTWVSSLRVHSCETKRFVFIVAIVTFYLINGWQPYYSWTYTYDLLKKQVCIYNGNIIGGRAAAALKDRAYLMTSKPHVWSTRTEHFPACVLLISSYGMCQGSLAWTTFCL